MKNPEQIIIRLRAIKPRFQNFHLRRMRVFGSVATGFIHDKSDVDLLVDFDIPPSLFDLCEIKSDLEEILEMPVDLVQSENLVQPLRDRILKEAIDV